MKKIYLLSLLIIMLSSCINNNQRTQFREKTLPIEDFVYTFIRQNPDYALNDITKDKTNKLFSKMILDSLKTSNLLYGIPMKLEDMNVHRKRNMIHLGTWIKPKDWEYKGIISNVNVDIISYVNDSLVTILENEKYYKIYGQYIKRLNLSSMNDLFGERVLVYTPNISIEKEFSYIDINLGILYFKIDSIIPFNGRDKEIIIYQQ